MSGLQPALFLDHHDGIVQMDSSNVGLPRGGCSAVVIPSVHVIDHLLDMSDGGAVTIVAASIRTSGPIRGMQVLHNVKPTGFERWKQNVKALALVAADVRAVVK